MANLYQKNKKLSSKTLWGGGLIGFGLLSILAFPIAGMYIGAAIAANATASITGTAVLLKIPYILTGILAGGTAGTVIGAVTSIGSIITGINIGEFLGKDKANISNIKLLIKSKFKRKAIKNRTVTKLKPSLENIEKLEQAFSSKASNRKKHKAKKLVNTQTANMHAKLK